MTKDDSQFFKDGLELLNRTQGRDLFKPEYLDLRTSDPDSYVAGAFLGDELIAVGVAQVIDSFSFYLPFDSLIEEDLKGKTVGSFSTLCVSEDFQGRGIGKILSKMRLVWLRARSCETIVGVSWVSGLAHTSDRVFEKMGFLPVKKVEGFFYESSIQNPFICPGCGDPPCTCAAVMYRLNLTGKNDGKL